ncbi:MAG: adenosylmethionine--8-amino-7-oxononanoate transaminase [Pseudomonadota bacterium]
MTDSNDSLLYDQQHIWHPYTSMPNSTPPVLVQSAHGCRLVLDDDRELIDGMSSWWSTIHGYNHPTLNAAATEQIERMSHVMFGGLTHNPAIDLARTLCDITPDGLEYVFFADSGSVAVEVAMKMAIQYWHDSKARAGGGKHQFLSLAGGYHGDTFATMSVCDPITGMHHLFKPHLKQQQFVPRPNSRFHNTDATTLASDIDHVRTLLEISHHDIAALILEPIVQGAGGMYFYPPEFLSAMRQLCDEFDLLLIADEIATGFGRTGKLFACEHANITPDILCLGKALTGGYMTLAATLCNDTVRAGIANGEHNVLMHGPTFMANPLACAVANASINLLLSTPWQDNVNRIETQLIQHLAAANEYSSVADVRVLGAIGVIELTHAPDLATLQPQFVAHGVWVRPFGKLVYVMPAFIMNNDDIKRLCSAMIAVIQQIDT